MSQLLTIAALIVAGLLLGELLERTRLIQYWNRPCTGSLWRRRFPQAPKSEIRSFLGLFVSSFALTEAKRLCFAPDDSIMAIYSAIYPYPKVMADAMELEEFETEFCRRYGVSLSSIWHEDITLGELFSHATNMA